MLTVSPGSFVVLRLWAPAQLHPSEGRILVEEISVASAFNHFGLGFEHLSNTNPVLVAMAISTVKKSSLKSTLLLLPHSAGFLLSS